MSCRLGVLALGDSITNGGGELQWGVALQSWALWTARGLGLPYTGVAVDGARAVDVVARQLPAVRGQSTGAEARWHLGCLYVGVNDVRALDFDADRFVRDHAAALSFLAERCDRVLTATFPLDLGRPPAGWLAEGNAAVAANALTAGALLLDLRDFRGRNLVMADHVHPTAFGQVAIAERALAVLAEDGMTPAVRPSALVSPSQSTRWRRLRGDTTYAYRHAKVSARAAALVARERLRAAGPRPARGTVAGQSSGRGGAPSCSSRRGT
jgi:lysophospholipase L1-like esterase